MFATFAEVQAADTKVLVSFYNEHNAEKPVKKFADRATAEKRVWALAESLLIEEEAPKATAPVLPGAWVNKAKAAPVVEKAAEVLPAEGEESGDEEEPEDDEAANQNGIGALQFIANQLTANRSAEADKKEGKKVAKGDEGAKASPLSKSRASNAAGVAASWADPDVLAARLQRHGVSVKVDGATTEHRSVREAFRAYRLPDSKHIRFRLALKASGKETFEHGGKKYAFTLVE